MLGGADGDILVGLMDVKRVSEKISETIKVKINPILRANVEIQFSVAPIDLIDV